MKGESDVYEQDVQKAAEIIKKSRTAYAFTGAGISTESGIPDFRSPGTGLWEKIDPMKESTVDVLMHSPERFYKRAFPRYASIANAKPNAGHYALAEMERRGLIKGVITQNIDGLHIKAGSTRVWEVHGNVRTASCTGCRKGYDFSYLVQQVNRGSGIPRCPECNSLLRPDIVLFGDEMSPDYYQAVKTLERGCDLMLVVGSSLQVYPAAYIPEYARDLIIINLQPTPADGRAKVVFRASSGKVLNDILNALS